MPNLAVGTLVMWRGWYSGDGRIAGDPPAGTGAPDGRVTIGGLPVSRRVVLLLNSSLLRVGATVSAADGTYEFTGLRTEMEPGVPVFYSLIAYDDEGVYDAVIRDRVAPVVP